MLRATGGERPVEVILLDPSRDGVAQMTEALASRTGLAAVHIVTHGGDGQLQLGDATLDAAALEANSDAIAAWSRAFAADGDLLLYGCNVAETARGDAFIHALALLTGADIAASDDLTGTARLGGDWDLERTTGLIETPIAFSSDLGSWAGVLAQLDWDDPAIDWPATGLGPTSFAVGGGNVTITVSDPAGRLNNSSPDDDTMADQGGLPVTEQGLYVSSTGFLPGESAVITIDFSHLGGVSNVSFTIFDLDRGGGPNFIDEVQASYSASGAVTLAIATGPNNTLIAPDTVQGTQSTTSNGPNSADANATFTFTGTAITQIRLDYRNAGGATNQSITLHDIDFTENSPPSGTNGAVAVNEDTTYAFAAANFGFSDPDAGDTLSAVRIDSLPVAGTFVLVGSGAVTTGQVITVADINAGNLRFTPVANVNGAAYASFTFSVRDSAGLFDVAPNTLTINVTPVNDAPAAANDGYAVNEDVTLNVAAAGVLANDSDIDGPALSTALVAGPSNGSLTLNANGSFSYTPNANFNGTDSFTYRASDGSLLSNIATVTITVNAVNDPPSAVANAYAIAEDGTLNVPAAGVLANDSDVDGPALSAVLVGGPSNAAAFTLNANGSFSYTPTANFNGTDSFTYRASDGSLQSAVVTVTLTVTAVNDAPVGSGSATLGAVAEDAASPAGATVAALLGGNYSDAADGAGATGLAGVAIVGNAATAAQGVWQYSPDGLAWTTIGVALSDASAVTLPATERIRFLPAANFNGTPGALSVRLADGSAGAIAAATGVNLGGAVGGTGNWSAATVALGTSITAVNDAPTFAALANQTLAEDAGAQTLAGFTTVAPGGGADEAGQTFGYTVTNDNNALFAVQPTIAANGTLTYTVAPNAIGTATVTVFVTDSGGTANGGVDTTGPRTFTITATPVADAPTLTVNAAAGNEDTAIALSIAPALVDTDGSESLALTVSAIPIGATLSDGVNTFTASAGNQSVAITTWNLAQLRITAPLHSDVDFTLAVAATATETANGATATTNANLAVTVNAVADTPTLTVNAASGNEDSAISLSAAAALVDVDGSETLAITVASIPVGATLSDGTNSFTATAGNQSVAVTGWNLALLRVTPPLNADTDFTLTVSATATEALGGSAASASANLAVDVVPVNDVPTLVAPAAIAVTEDVASALTGISFADIDAGASPVTATFTVPQGTLAATSSGGVVVGGTATALTLTGTVADVNAFVAGGGLTYTTALDAVTPVTLGVSVDDLGNTGLGGPLASAPTNVTLNVSAVNDAPVNTVPAGATVTEDAAGSITGLSVADVDAGAGNVQVTLAAPAGTFAATAGGGVAVAGSGTGTITLTGTTAAINAFVGASNLTYTTALDATAPVAVTMTTSDLGNSGAGGTLLDTDTFTVNVNAVNDAPTIAAPPVMAVIEDVASPITGIVIDDVDGTAGPVSVTLSVPSGTLAATSGAGVVVAGSGTGALALVGTTTAINAFLAAGSVTFTTALDATAPVPLSAFVNDLGNFGAGGPLSSPTIGVTLNVTAVNDAPVLGPVALSIDPLQTVTMAGGNMSATDVDNPAASIVFLVAGVTNGQFELAAAPGVPVTSFTQAQLASGAVRFAHTNAGFGPSFSIFVSDGAAVAGPGVAVVSFRAPGTDSPPEEKRRDPTLSDVPFASGTIATSGAGLGDPTATAFLRTSFGGGEAAPAVSFAEAAQEVQVVLARPVRAAALLDLRAGVAPSDGFVEAERIPTNLPKMDFAINAVRHDEASRSFDVALDSARITGMALSVGAVWWAARAGGLLASLLASTPAWRHVDPLPVLGRDEDEPEIEWNNEADTVREDERSEAEVFDEARAAANRTR